MTRRSAATVPDVEVVAVELTVTEGMLRIEAERRVEDRQESEK